ncbi:DUF427 domain-containing protein [Isoalcanivorax indicus]|uniref:DUF427 domain-containing protein n=1 Tax=Isoalcanivorax indicus TaxID=2202653 RepID=UPI0013C4E9A1|nr:DUF427 domain-containing protein [Isoalcanivorax indicus]
MKAIWRGQVIAQSNQTIVLGGHHYFPRATVDERFLVKTSLSGQHRLAGPLYYFDLHSPDGGTLANGAWHAPEAPGELAILADHIAFEASVQVTS